jgi:hypothetical protein
MDKKLASTRLGVEFMKSTVCLLMLLPLVAPHGAEAATTRLAVPSQQAEEPPSTPVGDPYLPPGTDILAPQAGTTEEPSLDPTEE